MVTSQLGPIVSEEEFDLGQVEDDDTSKASNPLNDPKSLGLQRVGPRSLNAHAALDILHYFTEIESPDATEEFESVQRVCKLCW